MSKKLIIYFSIVGILIFSIPNDISLAQNEPYLLVTTSKSSYQLGEEIQVYITLGNPTDSTITYNFGSTHHYDLYFYDLDGNLTLDYHANSVFLAVLTSISVPPHEQILLTNYQYISWNQTFKHVKSETVDGNFSIKVWYEPVCNEGYIINSTLVGYDLPSNSVEISIAAPDGSPIDCDNIEIDSDDDDLPDSWEYNYFGNLELNAYADPDFDGFWNIDEFEEGTIPTDPESYPRDSLSDILFPALIFIFDFLAIGLILISLRQNNRKRKK